MAVTFRLTGDKRLDRKFRALPVKVQKKVLRPAVREAGKVILSAAQANTPVRTGTLRQSLKVRAQKRTRKPKVGINVMTAAGWFKGDTYYCAFVEFGHRLGKRSAGIKRAQKNKTYDPSKDPRAEVPAVHFVERAYREAGAAAKAVAMERIKAGILREAAAH